MYMMIYKFLTWSACFSISLLFAWASLANFLKTSVWNSKHSQMQTFYRKVCVYINIIGHENHKVKTFDFIWASISSFFFLRASIFLSRGYSFDLAAFNSSTFLSLYFFTSSCCCLCDSYSYHHKMTCKQAIGFITNWKLNFHSV